MNGEFIKRLRTGGELHVNSLNWKISYYFAGPDLRYNGTFKYIDSLEVDKYITAWRNNFEKFKNMRNLIPKGTDFSVLGEMGMTIRIGGWNEGVCLVSYHMPVKTQQELDRVIEDYVNAKVTAIKLQEVLKDLK